MKFGSVPLSDAQGGILAHSMPVAGGRLRKGRVLSAEDLTALAQAGHKQIVVARLDPDDVQEDEAARQLANALVPDPDAHGLYLGRASTGRVNISATEPGIVKIDVAAIRAANRVDPMITIATVPEWQRMQAGGMVATVKIISYGVTQSALVRACLTANAALSLQRPKLRTATLIQSTVGDARPAKGYRAIKSRLDALDVALAPEVIVPHRQVDLCHAIRAARTDLVLILTGSATSDISDVAPAALVEAGGRVIHFGMPVDPGNLLFLGEVGGKAVIGLPGCARSPALNGADWVLERIVCGVPITPEDIADMGVGGLLKDIPTRPLPRRKIDEDQAPKEEPAP